MTEVVFRPLEALKVSMKPKKMEGFRSDDLESELDLDVDVDVDVDSDNNTKKTNVSHKYLHALVSNLTDNHKTYDRNLVLERLKKNKMVMTYCHADMYSPENQIDLEVEEDSIRSEIQESEKRQKETEMETDKSMNEVIDSIVEPVAKAKKLKQRIQIDTPVQIPNKPIEPVDLPDEGSFDPGTKDFMIMVKHDSSGRKIGLKVLQGY